MTKQTNDYKNPTIKLEENKIIATYEIEWQEKTACYFITKQNNIQKIHDFFSDNFWFEGYIISQLKTAWLIKRFDETKQDIDNKILSLFS